MFSNIAQFFTHTTTLIIQFLTANLLLTLLAVVAGIIVGLVAGMYFSK